MSNKGNQGKNNGMFLALQECHTLKEDICPGAHSFARDPPGRMRVDSAAAEQRKIAFCSEVRWHTE